MPICTQRRDRRSRLFSTVSLRMLRALRVEQNRTEADQMQTKHALEVRAAGSSNERAPSATRDSGGALGKIRTSDTRLGNPLGGVRGRGRIARNRVVAWICSLSGLRRFAVFLVLSRTRYGQEPASTCAPRILLSDSACASATEESSLNPFGSWRAGGQSSQRGARDRSNCATACRGSPSGARS